MCKVIELNDLLDKIKAGNATATELKQARRAIKNSKKRK